MFIHSSHPLAPKFKQVLQNGKTAKSSKTRLTDAVSHGCPGFTGLLRPPLSNEIIPIGERILAPELSSQATMSSYDDLFTDDIANNSVYCVAFSEPTKLSHKSMVLPGTIPLPPVLKPEDKWISKPRLNRGGKSIAFMGGSNAQQSQTGGHRSMSWGSMEPTPKRQQFRGQNSFLNQGHGNSLPPPPRRLPPPPPPQGHTGTWNHQQQKRLVYQMQQSEYKQFSHRPHYNNYVHHNQQHTQRCRNQQFQQHQPMGIQQDQPWQQAPQPYSQNHQQGRSNHFTQNEMNFNQVTSSYQISGFNFRSYNQSPAISHSRPPHQRSGNVKKSTMKSLKAQLKSTLKQNRRSKERR